MSSTEIQGKSERSVSVEEREGKGDEGGEERKRIENERDCTRPDHLGSSHTDTSTR